METESDNQKSAHGGSATIAWIAVSVYLLLSRDYSPGLISLAGIAYLIIGMFLSAIIIGGIGYLLQLLIAKVVAEVMVKTGTTPSPRLKALIISLGVGLLILDVLLVYLIANFTFSAFFA